MDAMGELEALAGERGPGLCDAAVQRGANGDFETAVLLPSPLASPGWAPCTPVNYRSPDVETVGYDFKPQCSLPTGWFVMHEKTGMQLL